MPTDPKVTHERNPLPLMVTCGRCGKEAYITVTDDDGDRICLACRAEDMDSRDLDREYGDR